MICDAFIFNCDIGCVRHFLSICVMRLCTLAFCAALIIIVGAGPALGVRGLPCSIVLIAGVRLVTEMSALAALILAQVMAL